MDSLQTNIEEVISSYHSLPHQNTPEDLPIISIPTSSLPTPDSESASRIAPAPIVLTIDGAIPLNVHLKVVNSYPIIFAFARGDGKLIHLIDLNESLDFNQLYCILDGEKGVIEKSGLIQIGDSLISCNDTSFENLPLLQIREHLKPSIMIPQKVLTFLRLPVDESIIDIKGPTNFEFRNRYLEYHLLLSSPILDESRIRQLCMTGIPDEKRPMYWRILLGYLPKETSRWESFLKAQRELYNEIAEAMRVDELLDLPRCLENDQEDAAVVHAIQMDVIRTHPSLQFFIRDK